MKTKRLCWSPSKTFTEDGEKYLISVQVRLSDDCKNGHCDFGITGDIYHIAGNGRREWYSGGCIHEEIERHFPELRKFIPLHLCNYLGHPMYPEANGQYFIREKGLKVAIEQLRITSEEFLKLSAVTEREDRPYFKYLLYELGIVERWKKEADEFIAFLEDKTGNQWENPYAESGERNVMHLTQEERESAEKALATVYYTPEAIEERIKERYKAKQQAEREEVIKQYEATERKAREERDVKLYIFDNGMPIDNVIYYDHTKECVFNWLDYRKKVSKEMFDEFISKIDYSKLPEGITFHFSPEDRKKK